MAQNKWCISTPTHKLWQHCYWSKYQSYCNDFFPSQVWMRKLDKVEVKQIKLIKQSYICTKLDYTADYANNLNEEIKKEKEKKTAIWAAILD